MIPWDLLSAFPHTVPHTTRPFRQLGCFMMVFGMTRRRGERTTYRARGGHATDWANQTRSGFEIQDFHPRWRRASHWKWQGTAGEDAGEVVTYWTSEPQTWIPDLKDSVSSGILATCHYRNTVVEHCLHVQQVIKVNWAGSTSDMLNMCVATSTSMSSTLSSTVHILSNVFFFFPWFIFPKAELDFKLYAFIIW